LSRALNDRLITAAAEIAARLLNTLSDDREMPDKSGS
jgi:hypothetical protein